MMRLSVLAVLLAFGALIGLSAEKPAVAAPRAPTVKVANVSTDYTFTYNSQSGKVRTFDLPPNYDEKGNPKKYTKAELQKLKGDDPAEKKLPGYKADFSDLRNGMIPPRCGLALSSRRECYDCRTSPSSGRLSRRIPPHKPRPSRPPPNRAFRCGNCTGDRFIQPPASKP